MADTGHPISKEEIEANIAEIRGICAALAPFCHPECGAVSVRAEWLNRLVRIAETWAYVSEEMWAAEVGIQKAPRH
jgi:hypothetical protein